ncbi:MMPL family transporter, partial [Myxococcota bacterium]|nr:MMPL family transporter [Myxococcota bacterium]
QSELFRQHYRIFTEAFPQFEETALVVITSDSIDVADKGVEDLTAALEERDDLIETIYSPSADPFFEDHALLYLDTQDLEDVIERLAEAQPALTALAEDPSLRGLFEQFDLSISELSEGEELPPGFADMADRVSVITEDLMVGQPHQISWADEFLGEEGTVYRIIVVQGRKKFDESISTEYMMNEIRRIALDLGISRENGAELRMTGMVPLAHDELVGLKSGLFLAGLISTALLTIILGFGVRSLRIIISTFATLAASLIWTTAWAMLSVGEFNIISAAFAVLLIGLGVDFAIHIGLRYEEECRIDQDRWAALQRASRAVGGSVSLCALTSAIGFLAFIPTPFPGLAALGIIAGGGMFISLVASFTLFPSMLAVMRAPTQQHQSRAPVLSRLNPIIEAHRGKIILATGLVAIPALLLSTQIRFDFNTLSMRDPSSESLRTLRELQEEKIVTDYSATVLAPDFESADAVAAELEALPEVAEARPPGYFVPGDQETKLYMIEDAAFFLEPVLYPPPRMAEPSAKERLGSVDALRGAISQLPPGEKGDVARESAMRLGRALDELAQQDNASARAMELEALVINDLDERIEWLRRALTVGPVTFADLPEDHRVRSISRDGRARVVALPAQDVRDTESLEKFVRAVTTLDPTATGRPVVEAGIGGLVVHTFQIAILLALCTVGVILFLALRTLVGVVLILFPIFLSALITISTSVLFDLPFNLTNVVVIPMIMGLGVDNGIHVYMRYREGHSVSSLMDSSTPRSVLISALTTLSAFGSLAVSGHHGLHSLGVLLSVSLLCVVVGTLVVLPAMLSLVDSRTTESSR